MAKKKLSEFDTVDYVTDLGNGFIPALRENEDGTLENVKIPADNIVSGISAGAEFYSFDDIIEGASTYEGQEYPFSAFQDFVDEFILTGKCPTVTFEQWQISFNNNGYVNEFGLDNTTQTFKMPYKPKKKTSVILFDSGWLPEADQYINHNLGLTADQYQVSAYLKRVSDNWIWRLDSFIPTVGGINESSGIEILSDTPSRIYMSPKALGRIFSGEKQLKVVIRKDYESDVNDGTKLFLQMANVGVSASEAQYAGFISGLDGKANIDFSNISALAKQIIVSSTDINWGLLQDAFLTNNVQKTMPSSGYIYMQAAAADIPLDIFLGGAWKRIAIVGVRPDIYGGNSSCFIRVNKGDILKMWNGQANNFFVPLKGV